MWYELYENKPCLRGSFSQKWLRRARAVPLCVSPTSQTNVRTSHVVRYVSKGGRSKGGNGTRYIRCVVCFVYIFFCSVLFCSLFV